MYRLMKSEKFVMDGAAHRPVSLFRQTEVRQFRRLRDETEACKLANDSTAGRHYILDRAGREYYAGSRVG